MIVREDIREAKRELYSLTGDDERDSPKKIAALRKKNRARILELETVIIRYERSEEFISQIGEPLRRRFVASVDAKPTVHSPTFPEVVLDI
jgi:hypothetical protein